MMTKLFKLTATLVLALTASNLGVRANAPISTPYDYVAESEVVSACGFPIHVSSQISATEKAFFNKDGALVRVLIHVEEQDTFTANGITLVSEPYTFNVEVSFDDEGNIKDIVARGVLARIRLPGRELFLSAGISSLFNNPNPDESFIFVADIGRSGNLDALCSALTP